MEPDTPAKEFSVGGGELNANELFTSLYGELRRLASSALRRAGGPATLTPTAVLHEAYLDICGGPLGSQFPDRNRFMGYAARVMHTVVVDFVRSRRAARHGGDVEHVTLNTAIGDSVAAHDDEILRVDEAMQELAVADRRLYDVVELRYFGGLAETEIAAILGVTERTVQRDWQKARLFLSAALSQ